MLKIQFMEEILKQFPNLTENQILQFKKLEVLYHDWNAKINVISRKDIDELYTKHVLHSLAIAKIQPFEAGSYVLDVGTGGGFPGIPLAILFPETRFYLIDVIAKKIKVVQAVADALELKNRDNFQKSYIKPALNADLIALTLPDKKTSKNQKYRLTKKGKLLLKKLKENGK